MLYPKTVTCLFGWLSLITCSWGQVDSSEIDTIRKLTFTGLPGISSSPETGFVVGGVTQFNFDLYRNNLNSRMSQVRFGGGYSTKKQLQLVSSIQLFGRDEKFIIRGRLEYRDWVDRHYGIGNDASISVLEFDQEEGTNESLNYLNYGYTFFESTLSFNRRIKKGIYVGIQTNLFSGGNFEVLADSASFDTPEIDPDNLNSLFLGAGLNLLIDNRDNINTSRSGNFLQVSNVNYINSLGGDFAFSTLEIDGRTFWNHTRNHVIALRGMLGFTFADGPLPYRGLQRMGGEDLLRGYFEGTYSDRHMAYFDLEYRLPLFLDNDSPMWMIWKHVSLGAFFSGGKVFGEGDDVNLSNFRLSAGGGLRIKISRSQRTHMRIDYARAFHKGSAGLGMRQSGFYVTVNEAF